MKCLETCEREINNLQNDIEKYLNEENNEIKIFKAIIDIVYTENPLKINFFALGIRELIRIFLQRNSSDSDIKKCTWYEDYIEYDAENREIITRKQRMLYSIYGGLNLKDIKQKLNIDIDDKIKQLLIIINKLSKFTHIESITSNNEFIMQEIKEILKTFKEFLEKLFNFREELSYDYEKFISELITDKFANDVIEDLDIKATHYEDACFYIEDIKILSIDSSNIHLSVSGDTSATLQYGSNSDNKIGDGIRIYKNYLTNVNISIATDKAFDTNFLNAKIEDVKIIDDREDIM